MAQENNEKSISNRIASDGNVIVAEHFEGLLPHPSTLAEYDKIVPGTAADIIKDYKENAKTIRMLKVRELEIAAERAKIGQYMAFILGVLGIGLAYVSLEQGYPYGACFLAIGSIGTAFLSKK